MDVQTHGGARPRVIQGEVGLVVGNVEIEVDPNLLEKAVIQRNKTDFDGDLQILQTAELVQKVGDLFVDFLSLTDDQAEVGFELGNCALATDFVPRVGFDGLGDQLDQSVKVGGPSSVGPSRAEARIGVLSQGALRRGGAVLGQPDDRRCQAASPSHIAVGHVVSAGQGDGQPQAIVGHKVGNGNHQVRHVVGLGIDSPIPQLIAGDLQHLVGDHVIQVQRLQNQLQRATQRNFLAQVNRHRCRRMHTLLGQALGIEINVDPGHRLHVLDHLPQGGLVKFHRDRRGQFPLDLHFRRVAFAEAVPRIALAAQRQFLPVFGKPDRVPVVKGDRGGFGVVEGGPDAFVLVRLQLAVVHHPPEEADFLPHLGHHRFVRCQVASLAGLRLGLVKPLVIPQLVVLVHQGRHALLNLDFIIPGPLQVRQDLGIPLLVFNLGPMLLDVLLHFGNHAIDAGQQDLFVLAVQLGLVHHRAGLLQILQGSQRVVGALIEGLPRLASHLGGDDSLQPFLGLPCLLQQVRVGRGDGLSRVGKQLLSSLVGGRWSRREGQRGRGIAGKARPWIPERGFRGGERS